MAPPELLFLAGLGLGIALTLIIEGLWIIAVGKPVEDSADYGTETDWLRIMSERVGRDSSFHGSENN
jgi:hypothetical protein